MRILVADDDAKAAGLVVQGLKAAGYAVDLARDGDEAVWLAESHPYDVMVFDVMMPGKDGFTAVRQLRRKNINALAARSRTAFADWTQVGMITS